MQHKNIAEVYIDLEKYIHILHVYIDEKFR